MKTILTFILVIALTIFFSGCERGECLGKYLISSEDLKIVPFSGNESLLFVRGNDTVKLRCWEKKEEIISYHPSDNSSDYYLQENSSTRFSGEDLDLDLLIHAQPYTDFSMFLISLRDPNDEFDGCTEGWRLPLFKETYSEGQWKEDSLTIRGFTYHNIFCDSVICPGINEIFIVYYTQEYGLVKYEFSDGSAWELLEIDWKDNIAP